MCNRRAGPSHRSTSKTRNCPRLPAKQIGLQLPRQKDSILALVEHCLETQDLYSGLDAMDRRTFLKVTSWLGGFTLTSLLLEACGVTTPVATDPAATLESARSSPIPSAIEPAVSSSPTAIVPPTAAVTPSATLPAAPLDSPTPPIVPSVTTSPRMAKVAFVKTSDRTAGVVQALDLLGFDEIQGLDLFLKPNFNSADPPPGSTHNDTLGALVRALQDRGAGRITVGDRSGMGDTRSAMEQKGVFRLADELGIETIVFDELDADGWEMMQIEGSHWQKGFAVARPVLDADAVIQTCCLKTHRYGGHFTLSLKNSVGLVAKFMPGESYNYMSELHDSRYQRHMIAEINAAYQPALVVLDGVEAFVDGGPAQGTKVDSQVILAGTDRVAIDAVGVAILRYFGTTPAVSQGPIFGLEQIARAVELGLGVASPEEIELITGDPGSAAYAAEIRQILQQG